MNNVFNKINFTQYIAGSIILMFSASVCIADDLASLTSTCTACHGEKGNSINTDWPNLAGQKSTYLAKQLEDFRSGVRKNDLMVGIAKNITDEQIQQLSEYFSTQKRVESTATNINAEGQNVRAHCISCHGVKGITVNLQWPNLSGQQKGYLQNQLLAFKSDQRTSPLMQVIAKELTDTQIEAVAEYYSQQ